jgi:hypothetical protein
MATAWENAVINLPADKMIAVVDLAHDEAVPRSPALPLNCLACP